MSTTAHSDGPDTALARLLHASERISLQELQAGLEQVRSGAAPDLATVLLQRGLLDEAELDRVWRPCLPSGDPPPFGWKTEEIEAETHVNRPSPTPERSLEAALEDPEARLGPYVILEELGRGGMGIVLKAFDPRLRRPVAIKKILGQVGPEELLRFRREAELTAQLHHPGVATIYDVVTEGEGAPYLVMDMIEGRTLKALCEEGLKNRRAAELVRGVAEAVAAAHAIGVIHRDLKPQNVVVTPAGLPVVLDFGLARRVEDESVQLTLTGDVVGTPAYMAPEQALGTDEVGPLADVYGVGAILYECLTGAPPFSGPTLMAILDQVVREEPAPPTARNPDVHRDLETICLKCLEKSAATRYASAQAVADDLGRFLEGEPVRARPIGRLERLWRRARRRSGLVALATVLLLAIPIAFLAHELAQRRAETDRQTEAQRLIQEGSSHLSLERPAEAITTLSHAIELQPGLAEAFWLRGEARRQVGDLPNARIDFLQAKRLAPLAAEPWFGLGRITSQPKDAIRAYGEALRLDPDRVDVLQARGLLFAKAGRTIEAERDLGRAIRLAPGDPEGYVRRGFARLTFLDERGFLADLSEAFRLGYRSTTSFLDWTVLALAKGTISAERAHATYQRLACLHTETASDFLSRALARFHLKDHVGAQADFDEALTRCTLAGAKARVLVSRAANKVALQDFQGAEVDFTAAIRLEPDLAQAFAGRATLRQRRNDLSGARADYTRLISIRPIWPVPRANRAAIHHAQGDQARALEDISGAITLGGSQKGKFLLDRGLIRDALQDREGAIEDYSAALGLELSTFDRARAHAHRGTARAALGQARQAGLDYEESLRLVPNQKKGPERRAQIERWLGRRSKY